MGTHTLTKVGLVENKSNFSVMRSIILLERELRETVFQIKACHDHGMTAYLSFFRDEWNRIHDEIHALLRQLRFNIDTLTR